MISVNLTKTHQDRAGLEYESAMWREVIQEWRDDIHEWRKEHQAALLTLENALATQNRALYDYLESIDQHETNVIETEYDIAKQECPMTEDGSLNELNLGNPHALELERHDELRNAHEHLKRNHYSAMSKLAVLIKAMGAKV